MSETRVRAARLEDRDEIHESWAESLREAYVGFAGKESVETRIDLSKRYKEERFKKTLENEDMSVLVAEKDGDIVGTAEYFSSEEERRVPDQVNPEKDVFMTGLYVHPENWGEGIGTALLERGYRVFSEKQKMKLHCFAGNEIGKRFYERKGFSEIDRIQTDKYVSKNEDGEAVTEKFEGIIYSREIP